MKFSHAGSFCWILAPARLKEGSDLPGPRSIFEWWSFSFAHYLLDMRWLLVRRKGFLHSQNLPDEQREAIHVSLEAVSFTTKHLWTHVSKGACISGHVEIVILLLLLFMISVVLYGVAILRERPSQPKVEQSDISFLVEPQIAWLEVSVNNVLIVKIAQSVGNIASNCQSLDKLLLKLTRKQACLDMTIRTAPLLPALDSMIQCFMETIKNEKCTCCIRAARQASNRENVGMLQGCQNITFHDEIGCSVLLLARTSC
mmetsp:Transcript_16851/g.38855  ORF Transcript_16851/g.38855 Transcript_16851/m.38855 type:complete len:257 (+) Transcript_16851:1172-1942(+)